MQRDEETPPGSRLVTEDGKLVAERVLAQRDRSIVVLGLSRISDQSGEILPQQRSALTDPVPYEAVYYTSGAAETMKRLLGEFPPALRALATKDMPSAPARIIKLDRGQPAS